MNKRKIEINELKRLATKGKKIKTITVKYQSVLAYFKQKDSKDLHVFQVAFAPLINDLLNQLTTTEFVEKLESDSREQIKHLPTTGIGLKLESFELKGLSKQFPVQEICSCLMLEGGQKRCLSILRPKLMHFFKHLRGIYTDFCYCAGEKLIVESTEMKLLYDLFLATWSKNEEKGKLNHLQRLERKICRSLYFLGVVIENNIFEAIQRAEHRRKEEEEECGTRSEHKKNIKGVTQQVSTAHTISSLNPSNLSVRLKSEASQGEHYLSSRYNHSNYSQKSQKVVSRSRLNLWDKAQIKQMKFKLPLDHAQHPPEAETQKFEINYLSNDVQNILIEQAFKIQKLFMNNPMEKSASYVMVDYSNSGYSHGYPQYAYMGGYYPYYENMAYQEMYFPSYVPPSDINFGQMKRSLGYLNLVQTRKKDIDRYQ